MKASVQIVERKASVRHPSETARILRRSNRRREQREGLIDAALAVAESAAQKAPVGETIATYDDAGKFDHHGLSAIFARRVYSKAVALIEAERERRLEGLLSGMPRNRRDLARVERAKVGKGGAQILGQEFFCGVNIHSPIERFTPKDREVVRQALRAKFLERSDD